MLASAVTAKEVEKPFIRKEYELELLLEEPANPVDALMPAIVLAMLFRFLAKNSFAVRLEAKAVAPVVAAPTPMYAPTPDACAVLI